LANNLEDYEEETSDDEMLEKVCQEFKKFVAINFADQYEFIKESLKEGRK
jgi:hypothetical protein